MTESKQKLEKYRPAWCAHPPYHPGNYCVGLALAADDGTLEWFLGNECKGCEFHKDYRPPRPDVPKPPPIRKIKEGFEIF